jgi:endonuclease III
MKLTDDILKELEKYKKYWWKDDINYEEIKRDAFKLLIFTILSQNTSSENTRRAFIGLSKKFDITPITLANAGKDEIAAAIKCGGLYMRGMEWKYGMGL